MIFENKERTRLEPKQPGEDEYSFYDSSARAEYQFYRDLLNGWIGQVSEAGQKELVPRFRRNETLEYQTALAELTVHSALKRRGHTIEVHPKSGYGERKPDYLTMNANGDTLAYVEVTTFGPARDLVGRRKRDADIYNGVDQAKTPLGCRLGLDIIKHGAKTPSLRKLRATIEKWAAKIGEIDPAAPPSKVFEIDDWKIEIILFGGFKTDVVTTHAIATAMGDGRVVSAETEIRQCLSTKGKRYGTLGAPYLIAIADCKDELAGGHHNDEALIDAVFGSVVTQSRQLENGDWEHKDVRLDDGYWGHMQSARHKNVSAALLLPRPHLWDLRNDRWQPLLIHNPWADHPLPGDFLPLRGYSVSEQGEIAPTDGTSLADVLEHFPLNAKHIRNCGSSWRIRPAGRCRAEQQFCSRGCPLIALRPFVARL